MKNKSGKIAGIFQRWLILVLTMAFLATSLFLWITQTNISEDNAKKLLEVNISDVKQDIMDASDNNILRLAHDIADDLDENKDYSARYISELAEKYDVSEINIVDAGGIITASTYSDFTDYDMRSGQQSAEFMVLLDGEKEYVQEYQSVSYDDSISRKYAGVVLENGGFVQVGYDAERFQKDIDSVVAGVTRNRHVGEEGCIIISNSEGTIVSDSSGNEGAHISVTGIGGDEKLAEGKMFSAEVYGRPSRCMYMDSEGYHIIAVMSYKESVLSRNVSIGITAVMEIIVLVALFVLIYYLIKKLIVDNIYEINGSLSEIADGNLDVVVDVRSSEEFSSLSDDINSTVDTLKKYISDAEKRIDEELEFAKNIQYSAMPSVFPPYPNRSEFEIFARMDTAKEVGGDFYDFYFIDEDTLAFLVADVSGKGIPAAMFMMRSKTLLKSCAESGASVEEVFALANEKLCEGNDAEMFVTAWMGFLDTKSGLLRFANAGHNPPVVKHRDGSFEYLRVRSGFILAGMEGVRYRKNEITLDPGDVIYLYTDGITEAVDAENNLYGEDRLLEVLNANGEKDLQDVCGAVKDDVDRFAGGMPQFDDITMLAVRYLGREKILVERNENMIEMNIPAVIENIPEVTEVIDEYLESVGCPLKAQMQIDIAIDELFSNIAKYAYAPDEGMVYIGAEFDEEARYVSITFKDSGKPFDPFAIKEPDISLAAEDRDIGGLGIHIVKRRMDAVSYEYADGYNIVKITKRI